MLGKATAGSTCAIACAACCVQGNTAVNCMAQVHYTGVRFTETSSLLLTSRICFADAMIGFAADPCCGLSPCIWPCCALTTAADSVAATYKQ